MQHNAEVLHLAETKYDYPENQHSQGLDTELLRPEVVQTAKILHSSHQLVFLQKRKDLIFYFLISLPIHLSSEDIGYGLLVPNADFLLPNTDSSVY